MFLLVPVLHITTKLANQSKCKYYTSFQSSVVTPKVKNIQLEKSNHSGYN